MLETFFLSSQTVLPLFFTILIGFAIKRFCMIDDHTLNNLNNLVFSVFLPLHLFNSMAQSDRSMILNWNVLLFAGICLFIIISLGFLLVPRIEKDNTKRGVMIQGIFRSNFIIMGFPIMEALHGKESLGVCAMLLAIVMPIYNICAVIALEMYNGQKIDYHSIMHNIVTNPLIIATVFGIISLMIPNFQLPGPIQSTITDLGKIGTPLALLVLGGSFHVVAIKNNLPQLSLVLVVKLLIVPFICITAAYLLKFTIIETTALMILFGAPTAVGSYTMAKKMGGNELLAEQIVIIGTLCASLTMVIWITYVNMLPFV